MTRRALASLSLLVALVIVPPAEGAEAHESRRGFSVAVPEGWTPFSAEELAKLRATSKGVDVEGAYSSGEGPFLVIGFIVGSTRREHIEREILRDFEKDAKKLRPDGVANTTIVSTSVDSTRHRVTARLQFRLSDGTVVASHSVLAAGRDGVACVAATLGACCSRDVIATRASWAAEVAVAWCSRTTCATRRRAR